MLNDRGFNLVEVSIAMVIAVFMILGATTLTTESLKQEQAAAGKLESIQQNSEIKDMVFSLAGGASTQSCMDRMGLTGGEKFDPKVDFPLPVDHFKGNAASVELKKIYLTEASYIRTVGTQTEWAAILKVEQKLMRGPAAVAPVALGIMKVTIDSSNQIVGCNLDPTGNEPMNVCTGSDGTVAGTTGGDPACFVAPELEVLTSCPTGTSLSSATGRCVPVNISCYNQNLGDDFDGNKFGCEVLPPGYAMRYPSGFTPENAPTQTYPGGTATDLSSQQKYCTCGTSQMQAGSTQLCVTAWNAKEILGTYDDYYKVQRCNSVGQLEPNSPNENLFNEEGVGNQWSARIATCSYFGGYKNQDSINYTLGSCK